MRIKLSSLKKLVNENFKSALENTDRLRRGVQDNWPGESHGKFEEDNCCGMPNHDDGDEEVALVIGVPGGLGQDQSRLDLEMGDNLGMSNEIDVIEADDVDPLGNDVGDDSMGELEMNEPAQHDMFNFVAGKGSEKKPEKKAEKKPEKKKEKDEKPRKKKEEE
jgi:hypothetical protein